MDMMQAQGIDPYVAIKLPPKPQPVEQFTSGDIETVVPPVTEPDKNTVIPQGETSQLDFGGVAIAADLRKKLEAAMRGEMDFSLVQPTDPKASAKSALKAQGIENPTEHNIEVYQSALGQGKTPEQAANVVRNDPLVFDLNGDGDTNATVDQHGIEVDGATSTKWAEKGDGVLAFKGGPLDTVDSKGVKHKDAYETLKAEAQYLGIDTGKGHLDAADLQKLEANGLTMMVSNGDGTNQSVKPSELGITQMSLGGKAVEKTDTAGNLITTEGSFVRNGQTQLVNDMWLNSVK